MKMPNEESCQDKKHYMDMNSSCSGGPFAVLTRMP